MVQWNNIIYSKDASVWLKSAKLLVQKYVYTKTKNLALNLTRGETHI